MTLSPLPIRLAVALVAAVQTAVLGWMVWDRVHILRTGREITLETVPVDPRSLFRGDYVRLAYDIGRLDPALLGTDVPRDEPIRENTVLYVTIRQDEHGKWKPAQIGRRLPAATAKGEVTLKARCEPPFGPNRINLRYGIEKFFVPEGAGLELEARARDRERPLTVVVAVDARGNAAIKRILLDGHVLKEETPL